MRFEVGRLGAAGNFMQCGVRSMRRGLTEEGQDNAKNESVEGS